LDTLIFKNDQYKLYIPFLKKSFMSETKTSIKASVKANAASQKTAQASQAPRKTSAKNHTETVKKAEPSTVKSTPKSAPAKAPGKSIASRKKPVDKKPTKPVTDATLSTKAKAAKEKKFKVVRDSFTIPKSEFTQIADMKKRAMSLGVDIKKSELIRAGLQAIFALSDAGFKKALLAVPTLKTGRPSKS
jgi:hypothetical protein